MYKKLATGALGATLIFSLSAPTAFAATGVGVLGEGSRPERGTQVAIGSTGYGATWSDYGSIEVPDAGMAAGVLGGWYHIPVNLHVTDICDGAAMCEVTLTAPELDDESEWYLEGANAEKLKVLSTTDTTGNPTQFKGKEFKVDLHSLKKGDVVRVWYAGKLKPTKDPSVNTLSAAVKYGSEGKSEFFSQLVRAVEKVEPYVEGKDKYPGGTIFVNSIITDSKTGKGDPIGGRAVYSVGNAIPENNIWYKQLEPATVKIVDGLTCPFFAVKDNVITTTLTEVSNLPEGVEWDGGRYRFIAKPGYRIENIEGDKKLCAPIRDPRGTRTDAAPVDPANDSKADDTTKPGANEKPEAGAEGKPTDKPKDGAQSVTEGKPSVKVVVPPKKPLNTHRNPDTVKEATSTKLKEEAGMAKQKVAGKQLAQTGAEAGLLGVLAATILIGGIGAVYLKRRNK